MNKLHTTLIKSVLISILALGATAMAQTADKSKTTTPAKTAEKQKVVQTAGRAQLGSFAPKFAELNDDVLFGQVWNGDELSLHDRSVITVTTLMAQGLVDESFKYHLQSAKANGVSKEEIAGIVTHAAFYMGWPKAWAAFRMAKEVWTDKPMTKEEFAKTTQWPIGEPNNAYAKYFIGKSYLASLDGKNGGPNNVTFEPGCRNNWHTHHEAVQVIVTVAGRGWYQEWGKEPVELKPGVVIAVPEGVKHWHGAAKDSWFQHVVYHTNEGKNPSNEWQEPVADKEYKKLK